MKSFLIFTPMKFNHYLWLGIVYVLLLLICNQALGLFHLTDASYHLKFDTSSYLESTDFLINQHKVHPTRCIAYPLILAGPYAWFGTSQTFFITMLIVQACMLFFVFVLLFKILRTYLSSTKAMMAVVLLMLNVSYIMFVFHILTETAFLFFITYSFYYLQKFIHEKKEKFLLIAFACSCFSVLLRPGMYYLNMVFLFILLCFFIFKKRAVYHTIIISAIFLCSIGTQRMMMQKEYGISKISMIDDVTMYEYMNTSVYAKLQGVDKLTLMSQRNKAIGDSLKNFTGLKKYPAYHNLVHAETSSLIKHHTAQYVLAFTDNLLSNFHTGNSLLRDIPQQYVYNKWVQEKLFDYTRIWNMLIVILLVGMNVGFAVYFIKKRRSLNNRFIFLIAILFFSDYCFLTSGLSYFQGDRFNVVWMPLLFVTAFISMNALNQSNEHTTSISGKA